MKKFITAVVAGIGILILIGIFSPKDCEVCAGTGRLVSYCSHCSGSGYEGGFYALNGLANNAQKCSICGGSGRAVCSNCDGDGEVSIFD